MNAWRKLQPFYLSGADVKVERASDIAPDCVDRIGEVHLVLVGDPVVQAKLRNDASSFEGQSRVRMWPSR